MNVLATRDVRTLLVVSVVLYCGYVNVTFGFAGKAEVREILHLAWSSVHALEFCCEEIELDGDGKPKTEQGFTRFEFAIRSDGSRSAVVKAVRPSGEEMIDNFYEDGHGRRHVVWDPVKTGQVDKILITNQKHTHDNYHNIMCTPLSLMTPFGKPLYVRVDETAKITDAVREDGSTGPNLSFLEKGRAIRCELDSAHDWLPNKMVVEGVCEIKVLKFQSDAGRWFPAEGRMIDLEPPGRQVGFRVTNLHFNRELSSRAFNPLSLAKEGTTLFDSVN